MTLYRFVLKAIAIVTAILIATAPASAESVLSKLLPDVQAGDLVEGADGFGATHPDIPAIQVLKDGGIVGWAFVTSDYVSTR